MSMIKHFVKSQRRHEKVRKRSYWQRDLFIMNERMPAYTLSVFLLKKIGIFFFFRTFLGLEKKNILKFQDFFWSSMSVRTLSFG